MTMTYNNYRRRWQKFNCHCHCHCNRPNRNGTHLFDGPPGLKEALQRSQKEIDRLAKVVKEYESQKKPRRSSNPVFNSPVKNLPLRDDEILWGDKFDK